MTDRSEEANCWVPLGNDLKSIFNRLKAFCFWPTFPFPSARAHRRAMEFAAVGVGGIEAFSDFGQLLFYPVGFAFENGYTGHYKMFLIGVSRRTGFVNIKEIHQISPVLTKKAAHKARLLKQR